MAKIKKEIEYSKEIGEVMVLLVHVVKHLKTGGTLLSLPAEIAGDLMTAISGIDQVDDEYKEDLECAMRTVGLHTGELGAALLAKKA